VGVDLNFYNIETGVQLESRRLTRNNVRFVVQTLTDNALTTDTNAYGDIVNYTMSLTGLYAVASILMQYPETAFTALDVSKFVSDVYTGLYGGTSLPDGFTGAWTHKPFIRLEVSE
jgi:hypothetical protein